MAQAKGKNTLKLSGKIGDLVIRQVNGKTVVQLKPSNYKKSMKRQQVEIRHRMGVASKIASALNKDILLYQAWAKSKVKAGKPFHKIYKVNFDLCDPGRPSQKNTITPPCRFGFPASNIEILNDGAEIKLKKYKKNKREKGIFYIMYISFYNPIKQRVSNWELMRVTEYMLEGTILRFKFINAEKVKASQFRDRTIYICAITTDAKGMVVRSSRTVGFDTNVQHRDI